MTSQQQQQEEEYKCGLSEELLEKAKKELQEEPDTRRFEVQNLRVRLQAWHGLFPRVDTPFLLKFLRARKFDQEKTFKLVLNYYQMKFDNNDLFAELSPRTVRHILEAGVVVVLPDRARDGTAILVFRPGLWDEQKYPVMDVFRALFVVCSVLIESEETQVTGVRFIEDLGGIHWGQALHVTPGVAKKFAAIYQDAFPLRLKGIHYVNPPPFFDIVFAIIKQFMKQKLLDRIKYHGSDVEQLHEFFDPQILPKDYKGEKPALADSIQDFIPTIQAREQEFRDNSKFGFVSMTVESNSKKSADATESLGGTFKKISTD